jgi:peptide/nickel transport system substrate-binding protein
MLALAGTSALLLVACGGDDDGGGAGKDTFDDETPLVIARGMDINSLDPSRAYCDTCQIYLTAAYQTLIGLDPDDNRTLVPRLATSWEPGADLSQYTFKLNSEARFADGSPVEAKDVKWSWERLGNVKGSAAYFVGNVASVEAPDAATVVVTLNSADASFVTSVTSPYMVVINSDVAIENGANADPNADETDTAEEWFFAHSAGSGPYVLTGYQEGAELRLERNEAYWGEPANIKNIIMKETVEAVAQRQLLETGDADLAMQLNADLTEGIGGGIEVANIPSFNFVYIALWPGTQLNPDVDLNQDVRTAIRYAIDYENMINVTVGGAGRVQAAPIPNGFLGTANLPLPERDLEKARQLLAKGGYPDGFSLDVIFPTFNVYGVDFSTMFQQLKLDLAEVGIELQLQPADAAVWIDAAFTTGIPITAIYFAPDHTDPIQYVQYFGMVPGSFWSGLIGVENAREIELAQQALETADSEARATIFEQIGLEMIDEAYIIPMVNPNLILAYSERLGGVEYSACCNIELGRLYRE